MKRLKSITEVVRGRLPWQMAVWLLVLLATFYPWPADRGEPLWFAVWGGSLVVWAVTALAVLRRFGLLNRETLTRLRRGSRPARKAAEVERGGLRIERSTSPMGEQPRSLTAIPTTPVATAQSVTEGRPTTATPQPSPAVSTVSEQRKGFRVGKGTIVAVIILIVAAIVAFWPTESASPSAEVSSVEPTTVVAAEQDVGVPQPPEEPVKERPAATWPEWKIYAGYAFVLLLVGILIAGLMVVGGKEPPGSALLRRLTSLRRREEE